MKEEAWLSGWRLTLVRILALLAGVAACEEIVTVVVPVSLVRVTPTSASVEVGQTIQLSATARDNQGNALGGRSVSWRSNGTSVATVDQQGLVAVRVTVTQDLPAANRPVEFTLERWVIDTTSSAYTASTSEESSSESGTESADTGDE